MNVDNLLEEYEKKLERSYSSWKMTVDYVYENGGMSYPESEGILQAKRIEIAKIEGAIEALKKAKGV